MKFYANSKEPPLASLIITNIINTQQEINIQWKPGTNLMLDDIIFDSDISICRYLALLFPTYKLYGSSAFQNIEVDHWLTFSIGPFQNKQKFEENIIYLDTELSTVTYLVGNELTIADIVIWTLLFRNEKLTEINKRFVNVSRWYARIASRRCIQLFLKSLPKDIKIEMISFTQQLNKDRHENKNMLTERNEEGKFIELPGAEVGNVVVRFPPEASGYLHIGHAKAALLNQYYKDKFNGKLIMRFDDTNPAKEKVDFEKVILEDLEMLQITPDIFTHTSDYFDLMLKYCEKLIQDGKAYVDDTDPEIMKQEREKRIESKHRNNTVDDNMRMWREMQLGTDYGLKCCVRAKIDMNSVNGCLRDPTIYRCKLESHPKTGNAYKVYPTYDFACPIVDSIEGVTHCLRTTEYHDRDDQFFWFIDALNLRKPHIWEYSRLNMTNTVLSKRKLTWFVEEGYVDGWNDPRFPTVRGILRRGMTVTGLKQFIIAQGSSRSVVSMEWDKIWAFNKKIIDPIAPRYNALESVGTVPVIVENVKTKKLLVPKHPKNDEVGKKNIWISNRILIDYIDAKELKENENATFINWGNLLITKIIREESKIVLIEAKENLSNTDYKKTLKLTWLSDIKEAPFVPCVCVYFDHIITKPVLGKDEDFKTYINPCTKTERKMLGDPELINVKKGDIIQLQRRGFYICDKEYCGPSIFTGNESPIILFFIPDGHSKETPITIQSKKDVLKNSVEKVEGNIKNDLLSEIKKKQQKTKGKKVNENENEINSVCITDPTVLEEVNQIVKSIKTQGDLIRQLKTEKQEKNVIDSEVSKLLSLKKSFKSLTNIDWKPEIIINQFASCESSNQQGNQNFEQDLYISVCLQTSKIRYMQINKVDKNLINTEVTFLADLKEKYKKVAGKEWSIKEDVSVNDYYDKFIDELYNKVTAQGNKVRQLKAEKANKSIIDSEVKVLLGLKVEYKEATGTDYKPPENKIEGEKIVQKEQSSVTSEKIQEICNKIIAQGNKVRQLKAEKANKSIIDSEVKVLLGLKTEYKEATGTDYKPPETKLEETKIFENKPIHVMTELHNKIVEQGNKIRKLKADKANSKEFIDSEVKILLELKENFKQATNISWTPNFNPQNESSTSTSIQKSVISSSNEKAKTCKPKQSTQKNSPELAVSNVKKQTRLGLEAKKDENLSDWYTQVITKSELIEYYDVSGCYTLRPWAFAIWKTIRTWFDKKITDLGVDECYFPIFVSKNALEKEKTHIADFAPEVAWVTKSGDSELEEPVAIRPTSETVMYPAYAKWIRSHRDLPLKLNQWNNVVRWEFKHPQPFLRTREFLWQEGHTAYASQKEAEEEVYTILDLYAKIYTDLLAIPVIKGRKTEKEKFAGGDFTTTVEAFISASGRAIQGGTSHHLGQNFSKMFDIVYEDPETQEKKFVYQNSWGLTTRTIGVMIMVHADDQGLVLPPRVAKIQVVIVPCGISANMKSEERESLHQSCKNLEESLHVEGIKTHYDFRDNYSPGWKFNHWELKGVPIRIELGMKDIKQNQVVAVRRDNSMKLNFKRDTVISDVKKLLDEIQQSLYKKAEEEMISHTVICEDWSSFGTKLNEKNIIMSPFCGEISCEDKIKQDSAGNDTAQPGAPSMGAKSLCIPFDQPKKISDSMKCIHPECNTLAKFYTLFGRSY